MQTETKFCIFLSKVNCSNPCVGPLPRIKMSFFLLSILAYEFISTPKIITFLPVLLPIEKDASLSNHMPYPEYSYLSISAFLVNLTDPNKQLSSVG